MELEEQQENVEDNVSPSVSSPSHSNSRETKKRKKKMKRTRDLPNLTQCHSCGFRIDSCSGNDTLETLYSEWRVVLLCETCYVAVESSNLCSYCFKGGSSDDSYSCRHCKHIIHKSCFSGHADVAPWSFCCSSTSKFSICLDCWVPKLVADKRVNCSSKRKNPVIIELGSGRKRLLENVVQDESAAIRARELAVEKVLGSRRATFSDVEFAKGLNGTIKNSQEICSVSPDPLVTSNGSCRVLEVSSVDLEGRNGKDLGGRSDIIKYTRRADRCRFKYSRRGASVCANTNQYLIKYARRISTNQSYREKPERFATKYTRRKLKQRPMESSLPNGNC